jgi:hypothetical protein
MLKPMGITGGSGVGGGGGEGVKDWKRPERKGREENETSGSLRVKK